MSVNTAAALVGVIGLGLCVIPFAWTVWEVGRVRQDVRAARRLGRIMIAISAVAFPLVMWFAPPGYLDPTFGGPVARVFEAVPDAVLALIAAILGYVVGLAWMIRIYRTNHLEPDASSWRYRA